MVPIPAAVPRTRRFDIRLSEEEFADLRCLLGWLPATACPGLFEAFNAHMDMHESRMLASIVGDQGEFTILGNVKRKRP